jgi:hypothetical protein
MPTVFPFLLHATRKHTFSPWRILRLSQPGWIKNICSLKRDESTDSLCLGQQQLKGLFFNKGPIDIIQGCRTFFKPFLEDGDYFCKIFSPGIFLLSRKKATRSAYFFTGSGGLEEKKMSA